MEALEFIFSSFWVFLGFAILLGIGLDGIAGVVRAWRNKP